MTKVTFLYYIYYILKVTYSDILKDEMLPITIPRFNRELNIYPRDNAPWPLKVEQIFNIIE